MRWVARAAALILLLFVAYEAWIFAHVWYWVDHNPASTAFIDARLAALKGKRSDDARIKQQWVPYPRISIHLKRALIAAEDAKFLQHEGFDWEGIEHALEKNLKRGKVVAGGSTISQQLAKNLFLSGERNALRKAQEAIITLMLESVMSKRRILEIYLNVIEWGEGVFGAEAAARHYFGTSAAELDQAQAARLAAMTPRPRWYDHHRNSRALARKTEIILARMGEARIP
ncbi:MAG TPA: monofunctional biosynthetic peptidoglycan transglycosylase [Burkholderiales bacterium]|nr:monofunctional biosynthetic peptidoglycan transglycosylase [Burkholderiales bacterium]